MPKAKNFEIILGTYEEFVVGYRFISKNSTERVDLTLSFASHSHNSSVRCITHFDYYLASAGADDRIAIYDLKFTDGHTHLLSGGSDGKLAITRVGNWQVEKIWEKAHKGASIIDIAVHPSRRQAYVINLNSKSKDPRSLQSIKWAPDGVKFVLCGGLHTDVWITCASNGEVKVWNKELEHISTANTGCRNTCITVVASKWVKKEDEENDVAQELVHIDDNSLEPNREKESNKHQESVIIVEEETPKRKKRKSKSVELYEVAVEKTTEIEGKFKKNNKYLNNPKGDNVMEGVSKKKKKKRLKEKL
ncbi:hypothetical protein Trydic_g1076 [Trypoxylus dichotomus]